MNDSISADIAAINANNAVPTILRAVFEATGMRFVCVARVTETSWTACAVLDQLNFGLTTGDQLELATTFCKIVRATRQPLVIDHVSASATLAEREMAKLYGFESFIAVPLYRRDGAYFGSLCALDPLPALLSDAKTMNLMARFVEIIGQDLDSERPPGAGRAPTVAAQQGAELRQQLAVLGLDLLAPLTAILSDAAALQQRALEAPVAAAVDSILDSGQRMAAKLSDALDFAHTRLGAELALRLAPVDDLERDLRQVIANLQGAYPRRRIEFELVLEQTVYCDRRRVAQLFDKLLRKALQSGAPDGPVLASAASCASCLVIKVGAAAPAGGGLALAEAGAAHGPAADAAPGAAPDAIAAPATQGEGAAADAAGAAAAVVVQGEPELGLDLGWYIAAEIARAHGGKLEIETGVAATTYIFTMPPGRMAR